MVQTIIVSKQQQDNVIYTDQNVGKGGFRILPSVYNSPTCDTSFTQIRTSVSVCVCVGGGLRILPDVQQTDVWHNASNTPHNVIAISDQRPLCAIVGNCLCILNASCT